MKKSAMIWLIALFCVLLTVGVIVLSVFLLREDPNVGNGNGGNTNTEEGEGSGEGEGGRGGFYSLSGRCGGYAARAMLQLLLETHRIIKELL